jgi:hypothetical protein
VDNWPFTTLVEPENRSQLSVINAHRSGDAEVVEAENTRGLGSNADTPGTEVSKVEAKGFNPKRQPAARQGSGKARSRMRKREAGP